MNPTPFKRTTGAHLRLAFGKGKSAKFGPHPPPPNLLDPFSVHFLKQSGLLNLGVLGPFSPVFPDKIDRNAKGSGFRGWGVGV